MSKMRPEMARFIKTGKASASEILGLLVFSVFFLDFLFSFSFYLHQLSKGSESAVTYFLVMRLPSLFVSFVVIIVYIVVTRMEADKERHQKEELEIQSQLAQSKQLISSLEAQRHDFRNQLQIISALASLNRLEEIRNYIGECGAILDSADELASLDNAVIQALLLSFQSRARQRGIDFLVDCRTSLASLMLSPVKVSRILANILENAVEAASAREEEARIEVRIWRARETYHFVLANNGPAVPEGDLERVFSPGFSSKQEDGHGYGLYSARRLAMELGGAIVLRSDPGHGTEFHLTLPAQPVTPPGASGMSAIRIPRSRLRTLEPPPDQPAARKRGR